MQRPQKILRKLSLPIHTLILSDCGLNSEDLCSLAQAGKEGRLPELKYLGLPGSKMTCSGLMRLFYASYGWDQLLSLDIRDTLWFSSDIKYVTEKVKTCNLLSSLQKLAIDSYPDVNPCWHHLSALYFPRWRTESLQNISDAIPALQSICIEDYSEYDADIVRLFSEKNIYCHQTCAPCYDLFTTVKCHCEIK